MLGNFKLSDLSDKSEWNLTPVPMRVIKCQSVGLEGKVASKDWEMLTITEAMTLSGKLPKILHWQDPFMTDSDYAQASQNREHQYPIYPDIKEETDESKALRKTEQVAIRPTRSTQIKKKPVWDPVNMRMIF
jgi:hypothetical protein